MPDGAAGNPAAHGTPGFLPTDEHDCTSRLEPCARAAGTALALSRRVMPAPLIFSDGAEQRRRILVVEDDLTAVFALRHFFALAGYDVDCAAGPTEGLRLLDRNTYEAVITDLHLLPGRLGDGMTLAAHARRRNPAACIVMLTADGTVLNETEARRCGVDIYDTKPVDLAGLMAGIARVLGEERTVRDSRIGNALAAGGGGDGV